MDGLVEPVLKSVNETGGGWPVLVLIIVIAAIVYLARYVISRQIRINEERIADRKAEFEAQLERERINTESHKTITASVIGVVQQNTQALTEFSNAQRELTSTLRPIQDTLHRIDMHFEDDPRFHPRRKGGSSDT